FFFFFQAEDGIRDRNVTGVQTCALPISAATSATAAVDEAIRLFVLLGWSEPVARQSIEHVCGVLARTGARHTTFENLRRDKYARSEERRVGKEWRCRWSEGQ